MTIQEPAKVDGRSVLISFEINPDLVQTDEDLISLGRFVIDVAQDEVLRITDPVAWRDQTERAIIETASGEVVGHTWPSYEKDEED